MYSKPATINKGEKKIQKQPIHKRPDNDYFKHTFDENHTKDYCKVD